MCRFDKFTVKSCCWGSCKVGLKQGVASVAGFCFGYAVITAIHSFFDWDKSKENFYKNVIIVFCASRVVLALVCVILLVAGYLEKSYLLLPWLVVMPICIVLLVVRRFCAIVAAVLYEPSEVASKIVIAAFTMAEIAILMYSYMVVYSYYFFLRDTAERPDRQTTSNQERSTAVVPEQMPMP